jgi:hypothetical protein
MKVNSWTFKSNFESVKNDKASVVAIIETIIAISLSIYIWKYYDSFLHIYISLIISPFLLLKTKKSEIEALRLFSKFSELINFEYNRIVSYCFISLLYLPLGLIFLDKKYFTVYFSIIFFLILLLELFHRKIIDRKFILLVSIIEIIPSVIFTIFFLIILSIIIKVFSTIKNFSFKSIKSIPINWKRIIFEIDIFYPPELLPGIEKCNYKNLESFRATNILIILKLTNISIFYKMFSISNYLLFLIPSIIYRYTLKATGLIYIPLIWLLPASKISVVYMKESSKTLLSYIMFLYSLFVVFFLTIIPFFFQLKIINLIKDGRLPNFISYEMYNIFLAIEFNSWHLTRFLASIITIIIFIMFQKILINIEEDSNFNYKKYNWLMGLDSLRKVFTVFTMICTLYLLYKNLNIPDGYFQNLINNFKLFPW